MLTIVIGFCISILIAGIAAVRYRVWKTAIAIIGLGSFLSLGIAERIDAERPQREDVINVRTILRADEATLAELSGNGSKPVPLFLKQYKPGWYVAARKGSKHTTYEYFVRTGAHVQLTSRSTDRIVVFREENRDTGEVRIVCAKPMFAPSFFSFGLSMFPKDPCREEVVVPRGTIMVRS